LQKVCAAVRRQLRSKIVNQLVDNIDLYSLRGTRTRAFVVFSFYYHGFLSHVSPSQCGGFHFLKMGKINCSRPVSESAQLLPSCFTFLKPLKTL